MIHLLQQREVRSRQTGVHARRALRVLSRRAGRRLVGRLCIGAAGRFGLSLGRVIVRSLGSGPVHGNQCYVKLAWIGLVAAFALPGRAEAEIVAPTPGPALLAVARDGSPRVAFV